MAERQMRQITDPRWKRSESLQPTYVRVVGEPFGFTYEYGNGINWVGCVYPDGKLRPVPAEALNAV